MPATSPAVRRSRRPRLRPIALALVLLLAPVAVAAAEDELAAGSIPLRLSDAQPSYLGVSLEHPEVWACGEDSHGSHEARLQIANDGGVHRPWEATIPLRLLGASLDGDTLRAQVQPEAFDLAGPRPWQSLCGRFDYFLRLDLRGPQPISNLSLLASSDGSVRIFGGTLYVDALLTMTNVGTGETYLQALALALNPSGRWVAVPAASLPDPSLSNLLLFADLEDGDLRDSSVCVGETHPLGLYCLQLSPSLLEFLGGS